MFTIWWFLRWRSEAFKSRWQSSLSKAKLKAAPLSALSRRSHQFMRRYQRERQIKGKIIAQLINTHDAASVARREASLELWTLIIESDIHCTSSTVHNESQHSIRLHLCGPPAKSQKTFLIIYFLAFFPLHHRSIYKSFLLMGKNNFNRLISRGVESFLPSSS